MAVTAPTVVARGAGNGNAASFALTTTQIPATRAAGDLILIVVETAQGDTLTAPTGYTILVGPVTSSGGAASANSRLWLLSRVATGDAADLATIPDAGDHISFEALVVRGWDSTADPATFPVATGSLDVSGDVVTLPDLLVSRPNSLIIAAASSGLDTATDQFVSFSAPMLTSTSTGTNWNAAGGGGGFGGFAGVWSGTGTLSGMTITLNSASNAQRKPHFVLAIPGTGSVELPASGTVPVVSTVAGAATVAASAQPASGTVTVSSTVSAAAGLRAAAAGVVPAASSVTGSAVRRTPSSGSVAALSTVSASAAVLRPTSGTVAAVTGVSGAGALRATAAGLVASSSGVAGAASAVLRATGAVPVLSTVSGAATVAAGVFPTSGLVPALSTVAGAASAARAASGTVQASATVTGDVRAVLTVSGTVEAVAGASAEVGALLVAAGVADAVSGVWGDATLPVAPPAPLRSYRGAAPTGWPARSTARPTGVWRGGAGPTDRRPYGGAGPTRR